MTRIVIDKELEVVWLPPTAEEFETLKTQILRDGCLDPLKVWDRDGELVLLDGHNRLKICKDAGLPEPDTTTIDIKNRQGRARRGTVRQGKEPGMARHGRARQGKARQGTRKQRGIEI